MLETKFNKRFLNTLIWDLYSNEVSILYIKTQWFPCLFVCGIDWGTVQSNRLEIWHAGVRCCCDEQVLRSKRYLHLVPRKVTKCLGLSDLRVTIKLCRLSIGAVTPNWLSNLVLHTIDPLSSPNFDQYDFALHFRWQ